MEKVVLEQVLVTGLPLYEMQQLFHLTGQYSDIRISSSPCCRANGCPATPVPMNRTSTPSFSRVYQRRL